MKRSETTYSTLEEVVRTINDNPSPLWLEYLAATREATLTSVDDALELKMIKDIIARIKDDEHNPGFNEDLINYIKQLWTTKPGLMAIAIGRNLETLQKTNPATYDKFIIEFKMIYEQIIHRLP